MDFKKLFRKDDKAVSPVIGVILMVAITVILAAAIGSSVFGQGTTKSAPQANIDVKAGTAGDATDPTATIKLEHLGGGTLDFENCKANITVSVNDGNSVQVLNTGLGTLEVGGVKNVPLQNMDGDDILAGTGDYIDSGDIVYVKITDSQTNQLLSDRSVKFL